MAELSSTVTVSPGRMLNVSYNVYAYIVIITAIDAATRSICVWTLRFIIVWKSNLLVSPLRAGLGDPVRDCVDLADLADRVDRVPLALVARRVATVRRWISALVSESAVIMLMNVKHGLCELVGKTYDIMYSSRSHVQITVTLSEISELLPGCCCRNVGRLWRRTGVV